MRRSEKRSGKDAAGRLDTAESVIPRRRQRASGRGSTVSFPFLDTMHWGLFSFHFLFLDTMHQGLFSVRFLSLVMMYQGLLSVRFSGRHGDEFVLDSLLGLLSFPSVCFRFAEIKSWRDE